MHLRLVLFALLLNVGIHYKNHLIWYYLCLEIPFVGQNILFLHGNHIHNFHLNKIADSILAFEPQGVVYFNGNYEEYRRSKSGIFQTQQVEDIIRAKQREIENPISYSCEYLILSMYFDNGKFLFL